MPKGTLLDQVFGLPCSDKVLHVSMDTVQWSYYSSPGHPAMRNVLSYTIRNLMNPDHCKMRLCGKLGVLAITGASHLTLKLSQIPALTRGLADPNTKPNPKLNPDPNPKP